MWIAFFRESEYILAVAVRLCDHRCGKRISVRDIQAACDIHSGEYSINVSGDY